MAGDIRVISILPPQAGGVQQPPQVAQGPGSQTPNIALSFPTGSVLSGFIINRDAGGNPILRTDTGDVTFASDFFLKIGSEVVVRIENRGGATLAHLLTVNGQSPEVATAQSGFSQIPEVIVSPSLTAAKPQTPAAANPAAPTVPNISTSGTVLSLPQEASAPSLPVGSQLSLKLVALEPAANPIVSSTTPAAPALAPASAVPISNPALYAAYARTANATPTIENAAFDAPAATPPAVASSVTNPPATPATAAPVIPAVTSPTPVAAITVLAESAIAAAPPLANTPAATAAIPAATPAPALAIGQTISATVIANEPTGEALVQTPIGIIRLQPGTVLPVGSKVTFSVEHIAAAAAQTVSTETKPAPTVSLARQWTTLQDIFTLLGQRPPGSEAPGTVPPPSHLSLLATADRPGQAASNFPANISTGLLLFVAALRGGDFSNWLGKDNVQWLVERGHSDLIQKAQGEFASLAQQYTQAQPQHWQTLFFPLAIDGQWQQVRLFTKRDRKEKDGDKRRAQADEDTRFVIELELSQLGEMQMDGFVKRQEKMVEFDLYIRSLAPLTAEVQQDIVAIYNQVGELTGYKGSLIFQAVKEFPIHPMEEAMAQVLSSVIA